MELKIEYLPIDSLQAYENNARKHGDEDVGAIAASIREFGFDDPIGIWHDTIVEGHGRLLAAKQLGMTEVPVIRLDHLTDEQRRAYALAHNRTAELSGWDFAIRDEELAKIAEIDMSAFGFIEDGAVDDWFTERERNDKSRQEGNDEYNDFVEKFEQKKTTDDCYTPDIVYGAIAEWVVKEYGLDRSKFVRPFYPGGDYQKEKYDTGCVVVDNPPFSILAEIIRWYDQNGIKFFLFAPTLTLFSSASASSACSLPCGGKITYENGEVVPTSFVTNLEDNRIRVIPELYRIVEDADAKNQAMLKKPPLPKYSYPVEVLTAAMCRYLCEHDTALTVTKDDSYHIRELDAQKECGNAIFGSGYLLSEKAAAEKAAAEKAAAEKAAAEKAAAEKAAAHVWELSEREKEIVRSLGNGHGELEETDN